MMTPKKFLNLFVSNKLLIHSLLTLPTFCYGAAFQHFQQSSTSIGYNYADIAVLAEEPATAFYNPAGMTHIEGGIQGGFATTTLRSDFNGSIKVTNPSDPNIVVATFGLLGVALETAAPLSNAISYASTKTQPTVGFFHAVKNFHLCKDIDLAVGVSITNPWGLETNWRYTKIWTYAAQSSFHSIAVNPSIALRYKNLSIGGGPSWQEFRFDYNNILFGSALDYKIKDNGVTWDVGALYEINCTTRFGLTYKPKMHYTLKGPAHLGILSGKAESKMTLPASLTFGFLHHLPCNLDLMLTGIYTWWRDFKEIQITSTLPVSSGSLEALNADSPFYIFDPSLTTFPIHLQDTFFVSAGAKYTVNKWQIRGGLGYESNPIKKFREALIPDNEHFSGAIGIGYSYNCNIYFDFGYQVLFIPKAQFKAPITSFNISYNDPVSGDLLSNFNEDAEYSGSVKSWAQVISAQFRWEF